MKKVKTKSKDASAARNKPKRKVIYYPPETMEPTPDRLAKSDFLKGSPTRVITILDALLKSRDISDAMFEAAHRWRRDYLFARYGYCESDAGTNFATYFRHDELSWRLTRAQVWGTILEIRKVIGFDAHKRLEWGLIDEASFKQMAAVIMPHRRQDDARVRVSAQFALTLARLDEAYRERDETGHDSCNDCELKVDIPSAVT